MSHGIKIFFPPASTSFSPSTFPWMLLGKTVAYSPLLHDNTVNYTRPHVLHMLYALIQMPLHPLCTLPLFPLFLKTNIDIPCNYHTKTVICNVLSTFQSHKRITSQKKTCLHRDHKNKDCSKSVQPEKCIDLCMTSYKAFRHGGYNPSAENIW